MFQTLTRRLTHYVLLVASALAVGFLNLGAPSLWDIDEGNNAEAAREMYESGNWIVPTFNYELRTDKPALLYWLQVAAYRSFGVNEFAARFPSALAALLGVLVTYELGRMLFDASTGFLAGLILASTASFCAAGHFANPDAILTALSILSFAFFWRGFSRGSPRWLIPAGVSAGFAVLAKGPVGLLLPSTAAGLFLIWNRRLSFLWARALAVAALAFTAVAVPWYAWVGAATRMEFLRGFFLTHNVDRYRAAMEGHRGPAWYYVLCLTVGFLPWSIFLIPVVWDMLRRRHEARSHHRTSEGRTAAPADLPGRYLVCWIGTYIVFFSFAATKLPNYILPAYPPLALLTARLLEAWRRGTRPLPGLLWAAALAGLVVLGLAMGLGALVAAGRITLPVALPRRFSGAETWVGIGAIPVITAIAAGWFLRARARSAVVVTATLGAVLFVGSLAAWGASVVDREKAPRPLVQMLRAAQAADDVRVGCYDYFQPSLVFYCGRQVVRLKDEADAAEFLRYPIPVYVFIPSATWDRFAPATRARGRVLGRHRDLYRKCEVLLVTNRI